MIDTHSHIYEKEYDLDRQEVVENARRKNVSQTILANVDSSTITPMKQTAQKFPDFFAMAMGLHPTSITADNMAAELDQIRTELETGSYCAVGEVGIDLYWDKTYIAEQTRAFEIQIEWAIEFDLPLIIHTRKAFAEIFATFAKFRNKPLRGVFHCFSGGIEEAKKAFSIGDFSLGIGGVVTYKNSTLPTLLKQISLERILLETDAPYLAPVPYRGKRNEPQFLEQIAKKLAKIYKVPIEKIDEITTKNAKKLFFGN